MWVVMWVANNIQYRKYILISMPNSSLHFKCSDNWVNWNLREISSRGCVNHSSRESLGFIPGSSQIIRMVHTRTLLLQPISEMPSQSYDLAPCRWLLIKGQCKKWSYKQCFHSFCKTAVEDSVHFSVECAVDKDFGYKFFLWLSLMILVYLVIVLKYLNLWGSIKDFNNK